MKNNKNTAEFDFDSLFDEAHNKAKNNDLETINKIEYKEKKDNFDLKDFFYNNVFLHFFFICFIFICFYFWLINNDKISENNRITSYENIDPFFR